MCVFCSLEIIENNACIDNVCVNENQALFGSKTHGYKSSSFSCVEPVRHLQTDNIKRKLKKNILIKGNKSKVGQCAKGRINAWIRLAFKGNKSTYDPR